MPVELESLVFIIILYLGLTGRLEYLLTHALVGSAINHIISYHIESNRS